MKHRPIFPSFFAIALIVSTLLGGCGSDPSTDLPASGSAPSNLKKVGLAQDNSGDEQPAGASAGEKESAGKTRKVAAPRKIIYDARVELLVESLTTADQAVQTLIKEHEGFLAESDQSSATSTQRRATWRVRVPVDRFGPFLAAVSRLGEVKQNHVGSKDVTDEYFDVEARIRNKQEEEKRLLKHLNDSTGKLEEILTVERELSRVRGEVEQMQGRLRLLADRTDLSTITIEAMERKDDKPPVAEVFATQLGRAFFGSVDNLVSFGKALLLVAVVLAPWLPLLVLGIFVTRWLVRASRNGSRRDSLPGASTRPMAT